ncbi:MAG: GDP-perosamine synthase [Candidatus Omnitrophica bacterium]|nr:GDP-perosamine synthase [Candidatus Omnitrophota bacterium]
MQHLRALPDPDLIVKAVRAATGRAEGDISLHEPFITGNEWAYVKECLDTGWVSSVGKYVDVFEKRLEEITGVKRAFAVVNGTSALHIALKMAGVRPGDEVLLPDLTFVATANAVTYCGATPHFVDSEPRTLGVDAPKLDKYLSGIAVRQREATVNRRSGRPIRALIAMHTFGHPVDLDAVLEICRKHGIELIEDAAEALGSLYKDRSVGHHGKFAVLSFNGNKIVSTGGGGAILTDDEELAREAKHIATTAKLPHAWEFNHDRIGYNYRMPNLNAAMGVAQLERLGEFVARKRSLADAYARLLADVPGVKFFREPENTRSNYWLNALLLDRSDAPGRDELLAHLNRSGIKARPAWTLMHNLAMFADCPRSDVSAAEDLQSRLINLPSSAFLGPNT